MTSPFPYAPSKGVPWSLTTALSLLLFSILIAPYISSATLYLVKDYVAPNFQTASSASQTRRIPASFQKQTTRRNRNQSKTPRNQRMNSLQRKFPNSISSRVFSFARIVRPRLPSFLLFSLSASFSSRQSQKNSSFA